MLGALCFVKLRALDLREARRVYIYISLSLCVCVCVQRVQFSIEGCVELFGRRWSLFPKKCLISPRSLGP